MCRKKEYMVNLNFNQLIINLLPINSVSKEAQMHSVSKILFNSFLILFFSCSSSEKDQEIILIASSLSIDSYIKEYKSGKLELCIDHIVFGMNWDLEKIYEGLDNKKIKFSKKEYINQMDKIFLNIIYQLLSVMY